MNAHLTVRVPETLNTQLHILAKKKNLKTSDLVRFAIEKYLNESKIQEDSTPYSRTKNLLGNIETGIKEIFTLDKRGFSAYKFSRKKSFKIFP